jgi:hypothetical protein
MKPPNFNPPNTKPQNSTGGRAFVRNRVLFVVLLLRLWDSSQITAL